MVISTSLLCDLIGNVGKICTSKYDMIVTKCECKIEQTLTNSASVTHITNTSIIVNHNSKA